MNDDMEIKIASEYLELPDVNYMLIIMNLFIRSGLVSGKNAAMTGLFNKKLEKVRNRMVLEKEKFGEMKKEMEKNRSKMKDILKNDRGLKDEQNKLTMESYFDKMSKLIEEQQKKLALEK